MPNKCIQMNLFQGTARAPITLQSLMHLLRWKKGSVAISISCLGKGNTARLSNLLKVTQKVCSRTEEWSQKCQVSAQPGDHHPTYDQCVALGEALAPHTCYHGLAAALMPTAEDATSRTACSNESAETAVRAEAVPGDLLTWWLYLQLCWLNLNPTQMLRAQRCRTRSSSIRVSVCNELQGSLFFVPWSLSRWRFVT